MTFTSTSSLLQTLLSNFRLRTLEILGPRERCCPGTHEDTVINISAQPHKQTHTFIPPLGPQGSLRLHFFPENVTLKSKNNDLHICTVFSSAC